MHKNTGFIERKMDALDKKYVDSRKYYKFKKARQLIYYNYKTVLTIFLIMFLIIMYKIGYTKMNAYASTTTIEMFSISINASLIKLLYIFISFVISLIWSMRLLFRVIQTLFGQNRAGTLIELMKKEKLKK